MHGLYIYSKKGEPHVIEVGYFVEACWVEKNIISFVSVVVEDWYLNKDSMHAKNKRIYVGKHNVIILILM
jgi:hypothetical protein